MKNLISRFLKDKSGATAIEYGLIAAGIRSRSSPPCNGVGTSLKSKFKAISTGLTPPAGQLTPQVTIFAASKAPAEPGPLLFRPE